MTADRWARVKDLFETARQSGGAERDRLLLLEPDAEISGEVRALLASYDSSPDFLEEPALASRGGDVAAAMSGVLAGSRAGTWKLLGQVGEGGMGVVYEAARDDGQFEQRAAVKILKHWTLDAADVARFRAERQILAGLDHPNIARLLDGGATAEGLPFYAMDFVEGEPIDRFCQHRELGERGRLELFRKVCDAVEYAHQRGIVHRDLKPANILVTGDATPKLLDFGIAKVLDDDGAKTNTLNRLATPYYASPEQLQGREITPASDIFSLGVLLYELLTGQHPFHDGSGGGVHMVAAAICEQDAERPSMKTGKKRWARELDHVILKALQRDPAERYASAAELSSAIGRYLDRQPVLVRVGSLRRQQTRSILKLVAAVALLAIAAGAGWWWTHRAPAPRRSVAVLGFQNLSGVAEASWISTALPEMLATELASSERVRMVSSETVTQVKNDLKLPDSQSYARDVVERLRANLNVEYFVTGSYLSSPDRSLRVYARLQDARSGQIIAASTGLGTATQLPSLVNEVVDELLRGTDWKDAARGRPRGALGPYANPESTKRYAEGQARLRAFDTSGARVLFEKAVAADPENPLAHSAYSGALAALGYEEKAQGEAKLAYDLSASLPREERLAIEGRYHEAMHDWLPATATYGTLWELFSDNPEYGLRLARVQDAAAKPKEAMVTLEALRARQSDPRIDLEEARAAGMQSDYQRQLLSSERAYESAARLKARLLMASSMQEKGDALYGLNRDDEALAPYESAEAIYREMGNDFGAASILHREGRLFWKKGDYAHLAERNEQALAMFEKIGNKSALPTVLQNLALAKRGQGDMEGALKLLEQSMAVSRELGQKRTLTGSLNNSGTILRRLNRAAEARRNFEECLSIAVQLNDRDQIARSHITLELLDYDEGNLGAAGEHLRVALKMVGGGGDSLLKTSVLQHQGDLDKAKGDYQSATKDYVDALEISRRMKAEQYSMDSESALADIARARGDFSTAHRYLAEAKAYYIQRQQKSELFDADLVEARLDLAEKNYGAAQKNAEEAAQGYHALKSAAGETNAYIVLAPALLAQNRPKEARAAILKGKTTSSEAHDFEARMGYRVAAARVSGALGNRQSATSELRQILAELESKNWSELAAEVRAALADDRHGADRFRRSRLQKP